MTTKQQTFVYNILKNKENYLNKVSEYIWYHPETRFEEYKSSKKLIDTLTEEGFSSDDIKYLIEDDELRVFKSKERAFDWFFSGELPYFDDIMNSVGKIAITPIDTGMTIENLIYEEYLNKQENYKKVNDKLYIAWYL